MSFTDTRDHAGPQEAIDAAGVSGKGTVLLDADTTYLLNPGLTIQKPVGMEGHGPASALQINVSSSPENKPVVVSPVLNAPYTASGALSAGDRVLALNSVMGLSVGDEVFLTLGEDPHDPNEEITRMFNSVEAIAGMDVTFALPFPEDIPSATHEVRTFNALPEGIKFSNFSLTRGPGISSDQGLHIAQCRNISAENITGMIWLAQRFTLLSPKIYQPAIFMEIVQTALYIQLPAGSLQPGGFGIAALNP